MTCARYGVAVSHIRRGRITSTELVRNPCEGDQHHVSSGDLDYARELCKRMRACEAKYAVPMSAIVYTVVPLPVTAAEIVITTVVRW